MVFGFAGFALAEVAEAGTALSSPFWTVSEGAAVAAVATDVAVKAGVAVGAGAMADMESEAVGTAVAFEGAIVGSTLEDDVAADVAGCGVAGLTSTMIRSSSASAAPASVTAAGIETVGFSVAVVAAGTSATALPFLGLVDAGREVASARALAALARLAASRASMPMGVPTLSVGSSLVTGSPLFLLRPAMPAPKAQVGVGEPFLTAVVSAPSLPEGCAVSFAIFALPALALLVLF